MLVEVVEDPGERLSYTLRPNLPVLGPKFGSDVGRIRGALQQTDAAAIVRNMRTGQPLSLDGFELAPTDVLVTVEAAEGWAAAEDAGYVALIDARLTPDLVSEGLARELVRRLQDLRREAGLDVSDRILVTWRGDGAIREVFATHGGYISEETLALSLEDADAPEGAATTSAEIDGHAVTLGLRKA